MLSYRQKRHFETEGYPAVPDVGPLSTRAGVLTEYEGLLNSLCANWPAHAGLPRKAAPPDFRGRLPTAYEAICDRFQPMDTSLPGDETGADTPMHFGPAVFDPVSCPAILDLVEGLIEPKATANPIHHITITPPRPAPDDREIRAQTTQTDRQLWRQVWQGARARLARRPPIPIHRWQSDALFALKETPWIPYVLIRPITSLPPRARWRPGFKSKM